MKQSDVFSIIFVAGVGVLVSFFACQAIMGDPDDAVISFTALRTPITATLAIPEPEVFNSTAINPTVEVYVGDCEDRDNNGILDEAELVACGRLDGASVTVEVDDTDENEAQSVDEQAGDDQGNSEVEQNGTAD